MQNKLKQRDLLVEDLQRDFKDGVLLCNLVEIVTGKKLSQKYTKECKHRVQMIENVNLALHLLAAENMKLVGCGAEVRNSV